MAKAKRAAARGKGASARKSVSVRKKASARKKVSARKRAPARKKASAPKTTLARKTVRRTLTSTSNKAAQSLPTRACRRTGRASGATRCGRRAGAKHKGGPAPGTPSPMRTRLAPELQAHARRLFEQTDQPTTHIALDCGVDESVMRRLAQREGWLRFAPPPRGLPPVAKLLTEVEALERAALDGRHPEARAQPPSFDGGLRPPPRDEEEGAGRQIDAGQKVDAEHTVDAEHINDIARFNAVVMAHLDEFEAVRRNGRLLAKQHLATARAISILTEAFNRLQRLRAASPGSSHDDIAAADMPADPDAFRDALALRIARFMESRPDQDFAGQSADAPTDRSR